MTRYRDPYGNEVNPDYRVEERVRYVPITEMVQVQRSFFTNDRNEKIYYERTEQQKIKFIVENGTSGETTEVWIDAYDNYARDDDWPSYWIEKELRKS